MAKGSGRGLPAAAVVLVAERAELGPEERVRAARWRSAPEAAPKSSSRSSKESSSRGAGTARWGGGGAGVLED
jgi:hypothetical protein